MKREKNMRKRRNSGIEYNEKVNTIQKSNSNIKLK